MKTTSFRTRGISIILCCMIAWSFQNFYGSVALQVYLPSLSELKGWEYADLLMWNTYGNLIGAAITLISGKVIKKYGPRKSMVSFALLAGANFCLMCFYPTSLLGIGVIINAVCHIFYCTVSTAVLLANWYPRKNESISGYVTAAVAVASVLYLPIMSWLNSAYGIQVAMAVFGVVLFVYGLACTKWVVETPEALGLDPDGIPWTEEEKLELDRAKAAAASSGKSPWTFAKIMTNKDFLCVSVSFGVVFLGLSGFNAVGVPALKAIGMSSVFATTIASLAGVLNIVGSVASGLLAAKFSSPKKAIILVFATVAVSCLLIAISSPATVMVGITGYVLFMIMLGAPNNLLISQILRVSGSEHYGVVFGVLFAVVNFLKALGSSVVSISLKITGGYSGALLIFAGLTVVGVLLQLFIKEKIQEP